MEKRKNGTIFLVALVLNFPGVIYPNCKCFLITTKILKVDQQRGDHSSRKAVYISMSNMEVECTHLLQQCYCTVMV